MDSRKHEILALSALFFSGFLLASFFSYDPFDLSFYANPPNHPVLNYGGHVGALASFGLFFTFGMSAWVFPLFLVSMAVRLFLGTSFKEFLWWLLYCQLGLFSLSVLSHFYPDVLSGWASRVQMVHSGGLVGIYIGKNILLSGLGQWGMLFVGLCGVLISLQGLVAFSYRNVTSQSFKMGYTGLKHVLMLSGKLARLSVTVARITVSKGMWLLKTVTSFLVSAYSDHMSRKRALSPVVPERKSLFNRETVPADVPAASSTVQGQTWDQEAEDEITPVPVNHTVVSDEIVIKAPPVKAANIFSRKNLLRRRADNWKFPPIELLKSPPKESLDLEENLKGNGERLIFTLKQFDIESELSRIESGPVITRYCIKIASGIKVQKVTSLDHDIALAMRAKNVRIVAPIPGTSEIGIEVPNQIRKMVSFKELLLSKECLKQPSQLPLILGQDISGKPIITDLAKMPHLLIAGATGSGKSVCINTVIMSLLYTLSPSEVKIMMVDPKKVEMAHYKGLPHLYVPLITNPHKVSLGLRCLIQEMDRRYQLYKEVGVRNIEGYNKKDKSAYRQSLAEQEPEQDPMDLVPDKMPFIVVIIDELADLMMVARQEVESSIVRLAQLSRAVGIHLILATQRPSVDVVTGLIKANVPSRIAFRVSSKVDSRTVLDMGGADKLMGHGDMLFSNPGDMDLQRIQGAYLRDDEIVAVVNFWKEQSEPEYDALTYQALEKSDSEDGGNGTEADPLFQEAVNVIKDSRQASASFLQRQFRIGYNRASRLIDDLEAKGIIGPASGGGKNREIYLDEEE